MKPLNACIVILTQLLPVFAADPLPGTKPLAVEGPFDAKMVDGLHKYLDREIAASPAKRMTAWNAEEAITDKVKRLKSILGVVDERSKPRLRMGAPILQNNQLTIWEIEWDVLSGLTGAGLLLEPKGKILANVVAIPDCQQTPEEIVFGDKSFASYLAVHGCRVIVPTLIDRDFKHSKSDRLARTTNIPHREFIQRMAFQFGRTITGLEVQKVLAAIDWFESRDAKLKRGVIGFGEGGRIALYAGAVDSRINVTQVACAFGPREITTEEPIDRNIFGLLNEFGDAEVAKLHGKNTLLVTPHDELKQGVWPEWNGPTPINKSSKAAPGTIRAIPRESAQAEWKRSGRTDDDRVKGEDIFGSRSFRHALLGEATNEMSEHLDKPVQADANRHTRQFHEMVEYCQKMYRESHLNRKDFWAKADMAKATPATWDKSIDSYRDHFHTEIIGKLPEPTIPLNPRTKQIYDEKEFTGYEVMLDVYEDVFAYGVLLLPKDLKPGEKRPVVVCQHGLNGTPRDCIDEGKGERFYRRFARDLVLKGYIVYCPQNPYVTENNFRQVQRKAYLLKLTLYSFIIRQHQRTLDWLEKLPGADPKKIAFYGLSYGGKTAMRVPAVEKRYCLSICSGDFNEWIGKMVRLDIPMSYMYTHEYEMYEWNLGNTFNYAEMAYMIAPRPFMVERGHDDGVGIDEMVASEYAKVRYFYANRLKLPDNTAIEFRVGGHEIFLKGTLEFLEKHIGKGR